MNGKPDAKPGLTVPSIRDNLTWGWQRQPFFNALIMNSIPIRSINQLYQPSAHPTQVIIKDLTELSAEGPIDQDLHRHDFFFILILNKGNGRHMIDFVSYEVENLCVYLMRPGQVHELYLKQNCTGYILQFSRDFIFTDSNKNLELLQGMGQQVLFHISEQTMKQLLPYLSHMLQEYSNPEIGSNDAIRSLVQLVLIELYRHSDYIAPGHDCKEKYKQEQFNTFLNYLETYYTSKKQVGDYAALMNMTPYRLNHITKSLVGKTCSTLINEHLIVEAKRQLLATSKKINEVAFYLGFDDNSYFIRFFKKHIGVSPSLFRKNFR